MPGTLPRVVYTDGTLLKFEERKVIAVLEKRKIGAADRKSIVLRLRAALRAWDDRDIRIEDLRLLIGQLVQEVTEGRGSRLPPPEQPAPEVDAVAVPEGPLGDEPGIYFSWSEFQASATAAELGIDNTIPPEARGPIRILCQEVLDPLRMAVGEPVLIRSGYRSRALNEAIHGSPESQHMAGDAADIKTSSMLAGQRSAEWLAAVALENGLPFDQVVWYHPDKGGHVHISHSTAGPSQRGETLYCDRGGYHHKTPRR